jgi:hypothetical protein
LRTVLSPPPELDALVELDELDAPAAALDVEELLDDPHAATLATAAVNATARPNDRPTRRPGERRLPTSLHTTTPVLVFAGQ